MKSRIIFLVIGLAASVRAAPLLSLDFNCRTNSGSTNTQAGFSSFLITSNISISALQTNETVRTFGAYRVRLWGNGSNKGYGDRWRAFPTNQAAFTESQLLRDCVWSPDSTTNGGLNIQIEGLAVTNRFLVTIWSFDDNSQPIRASDWYANTVLVREAYQFTNSVMPLDNEQYRFSFTAVTDGSGQLLIQGRRNPMSTNEFRNRLPSVYLNALQIDPEPLDILGVVTNGPELRITFVVRPQPGTYWIEETSGNSWVQTSSVAYSAPVNNRVIARFPRPTQPRLYRIRYNY